MKRTSEAPQGSTPGINEIGDDGVAALAHALRENIIGLHALGWQPNWKDTALHAVLMSYNNELTLAVQPHPTFTKEGFNSFKRS